METVAHDLTRLVVEGRPGTQARSRAGLDAFFSRPRRCTVPSASGRDFGFGPDAFLKRHFVPQEIDPLHQTVSPRATFISFRNVVAAPRYPDGRYAAGYRGAINSTRLRYTRPARSDRRNTALFCVRALRYLAAPLAAMSSSFKNEDELALWLGKRFPVIGGGVCVTLISSRFTIST